LTCCIVMSGFRSSSEITNCTSCARYFEGSNDALIEWLHDGRGVGWEEDR
jgi:hypothetical protein